MHAVLEESLEESDIWKRIRALQQWYKDLSLKVDSLHGKVHDIGKPMEVRGPDPDAEEQRYTQEEVRFLMGTAAQESRRSYGGIHNDGGKSKLLHWFIGLNTAILGWAAIQFINYGDRLTRLETIACQVNPTICAQIAHVN